jgi:hypothetical protein
MNPWFLTEGDVIPFTKKDDKVVKLPNVGAYPNFLTGVDDLQSRVKQGTLSNEMYKKLYTELLHRFMRRESAETPWFMVELAPDQMKASVQTSITNLDIKDQQSVEIIKQLYTVLNKTGLQGRVKAVFGKDEDIASGEQKLLDTVSDVFLKVAEQDPVQAKEFLEQFNKNPNAVNVQGILKNPGKIIAIQDIFTTPFAKKFGTLLSRISGTGYKQGNVGPGEIAMAVLSNQISLVAGEETGGDIRIGKNGYEVKGGGEKGKGGRLFDKGVVNFSNTKQYLGNDMKSAGNLSVDIASRIDPELQDFDRTDDPEDRKDPGPSRGKKGITSDPDIWVSKDENWWVGFFKANLTDWAKSYGVKGFLNMTIDDVAEGLVDNMGSTKFKDIWVRAHFLAYQQKTKHSGILLVGTDKIALLTDGQHLLDLKVVVGYGSIYNESVNQPRDITIQLGLA